MILDDYPQLRSLTWYEIDGLAQNILTRVIDTLSAHPDTATEERLKAVCLERDARLEAIWPEIEQAGAGQRLQPLDSDDERAVIADAVDAEFAKRPQEDQFTALYQLCELAAREEGPMDPALLAETNARIAEYEVNPGSGIPHQEAIARMDQWIAERKARKALS